MKQASAILVLICQAAIVAAVYSVPADKLVILDVGQGDAIFLQDGTAQVLIDGGRGAAVLSGLAQEMPWFDRRIEVLVATHPQQDHMEGFMHILDRYEVGLIVMPYLPADSPLQEAWLAKIKQANIVYRFAHAGQKLDFGDADLAILAPGSSPEYENMARKNLNNGSIIARADFHGLSFLLTGDAERPAELALVNNTDAALLDADILKVGHHGSKTSTSPELLSAVTPMAAAISVGADNSYGHPAPLVLDRLRTVPVFRTDQLGAIRFLHGPDGWRLSCATGSCFLGKNNVSKQVNAY